MERQQAAPPSGAAFLDEPCVYSRGGGARSMPEGDSLHRAVRRLQALVGERVEVETPHPRAAALARADRLDRRQLESRPRGRQDRPARVRGRARPAQPPAHVGPLARRGPRRPRPRGRPWLVLRGEEREAVLGMAPCSSSATRGVGHLGPDILADPPDLDAIRRAASAGRPRDPRRRAARPAARGRDRERLEGRVALARAGLALAPASPTLTDDELRETLEPRRGADATSRSTGGRRPVTSTARPAGRARAAASRSSSRGQGDDIRTAYWCAGCQRVSSAQALRRAAPRRARPSSPRRRADRTATRAQCSSSASARPADCGAVRAVARHRVEGVGDEDDPRAERMPSPRSPAG